MAEEKDVQFFMEDGSDRDIEEDKEEGKEEDGGGSDGEESEEEGMTEEEISSTFQSRQWPQSYRETTDSYTITASPSFGYLGPSPVRYSSFDLRIQSELGSDMKLPLLSDNILGKQESDKNLKEPLRSIADESISFRVQYSAEGYMSHGCSVTQTVFNGVNVLVGVGLLSTPFTVKEAGWASLALLLLFSVVCCYTGVLMRHCFESKGGILSYPDIGEAAFGRFGRLFVSVCSELLSMMMRIRKGNILDKLLHK